MALVALAHRHARAVPVAILGLRLLVLVVAARAERRTERHLVLGEPLDDNGGNRQVGAVRRAGVLAVRVGEAHHRLERLVDLGLVLGVFRRLQLEAGGALLLLPRVRDRRARHARSRREREARDLALHDCEHKQSGPQHLRKSPRQ